jgi:Pvc16 N-terminal domain
MFIHSLQIIRQELNAYLNSIGPDSNDEVQLGNISQLDIPAQGEIGGMKNKIVISLINVREEKTLKNSPFTRRNDVTLKTEYFNPPVFLNLYVLISACQDNLVNALTYLSRITTFFQSKNVFTHQNTVPITDTTTVPESEKMEEFKLIMDLYSPSFEELNHIWGTLGGKQLPSLVYVVRLVEVKPKKLNATSGVIEEIVSRFNVANTNS